MILQSIKMAFSAISSNKLRSFLTMLGIIIGVIAVVVLISLVNGATNSVTEQIKNIGTDLISVVITDDKNKPLKLNDLEAFTDEEEIGRVAPSLNMQGTAKNGTTTYDVTMYGTTAAYSYIRGVDVEYGRFLLSADVNNSVNVVVIGHTVAEHLFGRYDVVGEKISINGVEYLIVGELAEDKSMTALSNGGSEVYIPFTVASRISGQTNITTFFASAASSDQLSAAQKKIEQLLLKRFRQDEDSFTIINQSTIMDTLDSIMGTMKALLGGIAAISLLVGGIGIMNIMLVSVTERTREIGIRKAVGAGRGAILTQFLIEALMLSMLGGLIGLGFSWAILSVINALVGDTVNFAMTFGVVALALGFSMFIGVVFGLYPANKASKLHPIEALRYE